MDALFAAVVKDAPMIGAMIIVVLIFTSFIKDQEEQQQKQWERFLEFIKEQREANNVATARLAEEIKEIAKEVAALKTVVISHDQTMRDAISRMNALFPHSTSRRSNE
jgi:septal ring factor EnvC (AmiA/AmiB activator)